MQLVSFAIENYRSITKTYRLRTGNWTVLIGPNNEGKSNILRALATAVKVLSSPDVVRVRRRLALSQPSWPRVRSSRAYARGEFDYDWKRDFPVALQQKRPDGVSVFNLDFNLASDENEDFWHEVGSRLNGTLPIQITMGAAGVFEFKVPKQGPGGAALSKKVDEIGLFVSQRLDIEYIQAVRTAESARRVVEDMVDRALRGLDERPEYRRALQEIAAVQQPFLDEISGTIRQTLADFLPAVRDVTVSISDEARYSALRRSCEIVVDDGTATDLRYKGDGVQSIAALSLMRHASEKALGGRSLILAIEEPESHLHSNAIHQLRQVLADIAQTRQVFMTTHNAAFVDRLNLPNNIIVSRNRAEPASSLKEIRDELGVRASENLRHADVVLVVEGEDDAILLRSLLADASPTLKSAFDQGTLTTDSLLGASNLSYKLSQLRDALCVAHAFLDDDRAGRSAAQRAIEHGLATLQDCSLSSVPGSPDAEIEDLLEVASYASVIDDRYHVDLTSGRFRGKRKWSDRVKSTFKRAGVLWNDKVEAEVKLQVANAVSANPQDALCPGRRGSFDALVSALESKLATRVS